MFAPIQRGYISFRSHAEGFIAGTGDPAAIRDCFEQHYKPREEALAERLRAVLETLDGSSEEVPFVREWVSMMRSFRDRGGPAIRDGRISLDPPPSGDSGTAGAGHPWQRSEFHTLLSESGAYQLLTGDPEFLCFRLMLNYLYLHMTRIGVTPVERFMLCHFAANTVENVYGLSATDMIRRYAASGGTATR
jgi:hypothetical protein